MPRRSAGEFDGRGRMGGLVLYLAVFFISLRGMPAQALGSCAHLEDTYHGERTRLIVDTDMGLDDARALLALCGVADLRLETVMTAAGSAAPVDARSILCALEGEAPAVAWILGTVCNDEETHLFLCDEIAGAAAARPELFDIGNERFAAQPGADEWLLAPAAGGPLRIARLRDPGAFESFLQAAWERPGADEADHWHAHFDEVDPLEMMRAFHGHLGPYVVLGYRMGRIALERTGSEGHFGIAARVHCVLEPPRSCLIDGVQMGSGCTLGKRNIDIEAYPGAPYAVFSTSAGDTVTVSLRSALPDSIARWIAAEGVEQAGVRLWKMDAQEVFSVSGPGR